MNTASVEIVEYNILLILKLFLDNLSKYNSQNTTPKITATKTTTKTYIDLPNILAKININTMIPLLVSLLYRAMQDKSVIKCSGKESVDIAESKKFKCSFDEAAITAIVGFALMYFLGEEKYNAN